MILLTGATGFVGKRVLSQLLLAGEKVVCIARNPSKLPEHENLIVLKGDLENSEIISLNTDASALSQVTRVLHLAALYDLSASAGACYMANVVATMNLVALIRRMPKFERFYHVSTVAVAGNYNGEFPRDEIDLGQSFPNYYAKTKAQSESLLRRAIRSDKLCIFRPGIIICDSVTGEYDKIDGPYLAIKFFKQLVERFPFIKKLPFYPLPMNSNAQLPLVFVDMVVDILSESVRQGTLLGCHYLICKDAPTVGQFAREMFDQLGLNGEIKATVGAKELAALLKRLPQIPDFPTPLLDYMAASAIYDVTQEAQQFKAINQTTWAEFHEQFFRQALQTL